MGYNSLEQVDRLTIPEYLLLMEGVRLKNVDMSHNIHMQAWLNVQAGAKKQVGKREKPVFTRFKQFFDYDAELEKAKKKGKTESRFSGIGRLLKKGG